MSRVRIPSIAHLAPKVLSTVSILEAIFLGFLQGVTEFLPVSSSGHLVLGQALLGIKNMQDYIFFDLVCHLGTLLAIFFVFHHDILQLLKGNKIRLLQLILGTLPLFPLVLLLKPIKAVFDETHYLGFFFMITALLLYAGIRFGSIKQESNLQTSKWRDALIIGIFQAIAIFPGISRSGATISGARILGWPPQEAVTFSFLLAIPAILGGVTLEILQILNKPSFHSHGLDFTHYAAGFLTSCIVGYLALLLLKRLAAKQQFMYFVWYCLAIGIFTIVYLGSVQQ